MAGGRCPSHGPSHAPAAGAGAAWADVPRRWHGFGSHDPGRGQLHALYPKVLRKLGVPVRSCVLLLTLENTVPADAWTVPFIASCCRFPSPGLGQPRTACASRERGSLGSGVRVRERARLLTQKAGGGGGWSGLHPGKHGASGGRKEQDRGRNCALLLLLRGRR